MKLRNKQTGEIGLVHCDATMFSNKIGVFIDNNHIDLRNPYKVYNSLAELNAEWEDYEEPKGYWFIDFAAPYPVDFCEFNEDTEDDRQIGNYFETKEEAEKAVEKLKAMAKLKEFGFRFIDWELDMKTVADGKIWFDVGTNTEWDAERLLGSKPEIKKLLDLLFGGEE